MPLPAEVDQVVLQGFVIDEDGKGVAGEVVSEPVPLAGQQASPMVLSAVSHRHIQTLTRRVTPDATTGYFALWVMASNDPDVEAYGGRRVTLPGQNPRVIQVPWNAPQVTVTTAMAAKVTGLTVGQQVRAIWYHEAAGFTPPPAGPSWYTAEQIDSKLAGGAGGGFSGSAADITSGVLADERIPGNVARDAEVQALLDAYAAGSMTNPPGVLPRVTVTTASGADPADTENYLDASITINGSQPLAASPVRVRGRGNSTWSAPKKPWRLNFAAATSVLGLPADRDWALMANYFDPISLRTALAMELGVRSPGLSFTPKFRYVELTMNGTYRGVYQLGELVRFGTSRVQGPKASGTSGLALTGTYLLEWDNRLDAVASFRTTAKSVPIILDDPDGTTPEHKAYIQSWINNFETVLYAANWLDPGTGYARLIDMPSWVDWYIVNELLMNVDSNGFSSIKMVKTRDTADAPGKLYLGPLWDFDRSLGFGNIGPTGWWTRGAVGQPDANHLGMLWIDRMYSDPAFTAMLFARWAALRPHITTGDSVFAIVDRLTDRLSAALGRDRRKWAYAADTPVLGDAARTWLHERIAWLNTWWIADVTAPSTPSNLTVTPGDGQNALSWNPSTDDVAVNSYRVYRGGVLIGSPVGTTFTDTGRTNGTTYTYAVVAADNAGNLSLPTAEVSGAPVAGAANVGGPAATSSGTLLGWYKADAITGLADGAAVTSWPDSSIGNHPLAGQGAPVLKTAQLNTKPAVRFPGGSTYLGSDAVTSSQPFTIFFVARRATAAGVNESVVSGKGVNVALFFSAGQAFGVFAGSSGTSPALTLTAAHVFEVVVAGSSSIRYVDGAGAANGNFGANSLGGLTVGCNAARTGEFFTGDVFEIVVYAGALSAADRSAVRQALGTKYGLTVAA